MRILIILLISNLALAANNPQEFIAKQDNKNTWFAYSVKAQDNTHSMCCWEHNNSNNSVCDLNREINSFGSSDDSPITKNINIYVNLKNGKVDNVIPLGDACQVKANSINVNWLDTVTQQDSIDWLKQISIQDKKDDSTHALYAMALHKDKRASVALFDLAKNNNNNSTNAVFWLGERRADGVEYLQKLYKSLPKGDAKRHINFALSITKSTKGINLLKQIAHKDKDAEQRGDALFWLGQSKVDDIVEILLASVINDPSQSVKEKAIFSLSQVKTEAAAEALLGIAKNNKSVELRDKALFWLAQVSPKKAKQIALEILKNNNSEEQVNNAVFTISQLSENNNDEGLFQLITGNYSKSVKKQALFWLSQSDNSATIDRLQSLL